MGRELDYSEEYYNFKNAKGFENIPTGAIYFGRKTLGLGTHGYLVIIPDDQKIFFDENGNLKQEYKDKKYPKPEKYEDKWGWTVGGHNINGNLEVIFNQEQDKKVSQKILLKDISDEKTPLKGYMGNELKSSNYPKDSKFIEELMKNVINYKINNENKIYPKYGAFGQGKEDYYDYKKGYKKENKTPSYNCNSFMNTLSERLGIENFNKNMPGLDPGSNAIIEEKYFEVNKEKKPTVSE